MLNDDEVIIMNVPQNRIDIINLKAKTLFQIKHKFIILDIKRI